MKDIIMDIQVIKEAEILEDKTDIGDTEVSAGSISQCTYLIIIYPDAAIPGRKNTSNQVQQSCLSGTAGPHKCNLLTSSNREFLDIKPEFPGRLGECE